LGNLAALRIGAMDDDSIPLIPITYVQRVRELVERFEAQLAREPENIYAQRCLAGWLRELERLERGEVY
jgi:hypothetical protein